LVNEEITSIDEGKKINTILGKDILRFSLGKIKEK
jgi:hypothetical protein